VSGDIVRFSRNLSSLFLCDRHARRTMPPQPPPSAWLKPRHRCMPAFLGSVRRRRLSGPAAGRAGGLVWARPATRSSAQGDREGGRGSRRRAPVICLRHARGRPISDGDRRTGADPLASPRAPSAAARGASHRAVDATQPRDILTAGDFGRAQCRVSNSNGARANPSTSDHALRLLPCFGPRFRSFHHIPWARLPDIRRLGRSGVPFSST